MARIVHISDTHLGHRQYGSDVRRQDFLDAFEAGIGRAIEHDADAIIHTGDLFHRRTPPLPQVNQCIDILRRAAEADIPFLGIVGNHDRKMDDQWLDLIEHTGTAARLDRSPTMVGDEVAVYGLDAVPSPAWESTEFTLDEPENDDAYRLLCMHQLLHPPVPEIMAEYPAESVIERLNIDIDGLALGDYHEAVSESVKGVDVWYAGSTERGSSDEEGPRSIMLLSEFENHGMTRQQLPLDTREFQRIEISFADDEGYAHARDEIANYDVTDAVAVIRLSGKRTSLTASDVHEIALDRGAAVARVDDNRGREHFDRGEAPETEVEDPDTLIDQRLAEANLSEPALEVEQLVRDEGTSTNALADSANELITDAQEAAFAGEEPPEAVLGGTVDDGTSSESESDSGEKGNESEQDESTDESDGEQEPMDESTDGPKERGEPDESDQADVSTDTDANESPDTETGSDERVATAGPSGGNPSDIDEPATTSDAELADENSSKSGSEASSSASGGTTSQSSFGDLTDIGSDTDDNTEESESQ